MALTEDLKIYRSMYNLVRSIIHARNTFDKGFKYVVGDDMVSRALGCLSLIHYVNPGFPECGGNCCTIFGGSATFIFAG